MKNRYPLWRCLALYRLMPLRFLLTAALFILVNLSLAWQQWLIGKAVHDVELGKAVVRLADGTLDFSAARFWLELLVVVALARAVLEAVSRHGGRIVYDIRNHPDPKVRANNGAPRPITVDAALLRERPDLVVRFLARIAQIGAWAASHSAETVAYIAKESGSDDGWVRAAYGADMHLRQHTDLSPASIDALEGYKNFLFESGFLKADFSVHDWIDPAPLAEVQRLLQKAA
jgi:hypothetical protein